MESERHTTFNQLANIDDDTNRAKTLDQAPSIWRETLDAESNVLNYKKAAPRFELGRQRRKLPKIPPNVAIQIQNRAF